MDLPFTQDDPDPVVEVHRIVALACEAPSVHNSQPWWWRVGEGFVELHRDPDRHLPAEDPDGRDQVISCGAALHHAEVAARALRWSTEVSRLPHGAHPTHLATVRLVGRTPGAEDEETLRVIASRRTDRRRFTSWPLPAGRLDGLAALARSRGASVDVVDDVERRARLWLLVERAREIQAADDVSAAEQAGWVRSTASAAGDGVPAAVLPRPAERSMPSRFRAAGPPAAGDDLDHADGAMVLGGSADDVPAWLAVGEGLSALWLEAWRSGLSVVPLSQPIEVPSVRSAIQDEVVGGAFRPDLVVRVGWQALGRDPLLRTPRRPVGEVVRP